MLYADEPFHFELQVAADAHQSLLRHVAQRGMHPNPDRYRRLFARRYFEKCQFHRLFLNFHSHPHQPIRRITNVYLISKPDSSAAMTIARKSEKQGLGKSP
jgi:hypothetical protein